MKIIILGAGNWGTTLAITLASEERKVSLWANSRERAAGGQEVHVGPSWLVISRGQLLASY